MDINNNNDNDNGLPVVTPADTATDITPLASAKPARVRKPRATAVTPAPRTIKSLADLIAVGRTITPANWTAVVGRFTANHGVTHASRNVGRFTGSRIVDFQNVWMADNHGFNDCQLAAIMRIEHPAASGSLYANPDPAVAVSIVRGIRAEYNRNGHGSKTETWRTVRAERFGPASFDWPKPAAAKTA